MTDLLSWSEDLAIGHPGLDADHRRMVDIINDVITVVGSKRRPTALLAFLQETTVKHIEIENRILWHLQAGTGELLQRHPRMRKAVKMMARSQINDHMAEHRGFLVRLDAIIGNGADTLCEELKGWFQDHAHGYDAGLKPIFQAMGAA